MIKYNKVKWTYQLKILMVYCLKLFLIIDFSY